MIRATEVRDSIAGRKRRPIPWCSISTIAPAADGDDGHARLEFLLDLETAVALRGGDALVLEDGRLVEVVAAPEPLAEIRCNDPHHLVRVAWHLGNRHLPTQIMPKAYASAGTTSSRRW